MSTLGGRGGGAESWRPIRSARCGRRRLKACIANCGPYEVGRLLPNSPPIQREVFRAGAHAGTTKQAQPTSSHSWVRQNRITCPLLVMVGGEDKLVPSSEGERLAKTASGPTELGGLSQRRSCLLQHQLQIPSADGGLDGRTSRRRADLIGCSAPRGRVVWRHAEVSEGSLEGRAVFTLRGSVQ
jgi:hypothetical protein